GAGRRGAGEGLAGHADGARGGCARRASGPNRSVLGMRMDDALLSARPARQGSHRLQRLPLPDLPVFHGADLRPGDLADRGTLAHPTSAAHAARHGHAARGHAGAPSQQQEGHAHDGRRDHSLRDPWFLLSMLVIIGASNAVNLTDGLDGLAIGPIVMAGAAFGVIAYLTGNFRAADYLKILNVRGSGELSVFCGALIGAAIGFLWFNCHPAEVFMGDAGSLALGASIGMLAVLTKAELLLPLIGGIYVVEAVSVIVQVASFKLTGRRVFRMAPLHHHYELTGWP